MNVKNLKMAKGFVVSRAKYGESNNDGKCDVSIKVELETISGDKDKIETFVDNVDSDNVKYAYFKKDDRVVVTYYVDDGVNRVFAFEPINYKLR